MVDPERPTQADETHHIQSSPDLAKLFEALSKAQGEMKPAILDMVNPHYKSKYASLTSVQESFRGPFLTHGLCVTQQIFTLDNGYVIRTMLGHSSGQWIANAFKLMIQKNDMQGLGSAITYARRYGVSSLIGVVDTEDDDGNASLASKAAPKNTAPKNYAPGASEPEDIDQALAAPNYDEPPARTALEEFYALVESKGMAPDDVKSIIKRTLGVAKMSKSLSSEELVRVMKAIKLTK